MYSDVYFFLYVNNGGKSHTLKHSYSNLLKKPPPLEAKKTVKVAGFTIPSSETSLPRSVKEEDGGQRSGRIEGLDTYFASELD